MVDYSSYKDTKLDFCIFLFKSNYLMLRIVKKNSSNCYNWVFNSDTTFIDMKMFFEVFFVTKAYNILLLVFNYHKIL
jgi:hypothetical protein